MPYFPTGQGVMSITGAPADAAGNVKITSASIYKISAQARVVASNAAADTPMQEVIMGVGNVQPIANAIPRATAAGALPLMAFSGATGARPVLIAQYAGVLWFDTTLGILILWTGTAWVNAGTGAPV